MTRIIKWKSSIRTPVRYDTDTKITEDHYRLEISPLVNRDQVNNITVYRSIHSLYRNGELISKTIEVNRLFEEPKE